MTVLTGLTVLAAIVLVLRFATAGRAFSLVRATQPVGSFTGDAVGRLLAIVAIITVIVQTDVIPSTYLAHFGAQVIVVTAVALAVAPRWTDRVVALVATTLEIASIAKSDGMHAALGVLVIAVLAVWVLGLVRGFRSG